MAAKHRAEGTDSLSQAAQPTPEPSAQTAEEAVAMLERGLGPMAWTREFQALPEGGYVDLRTGETYDAIPTGDPYTGPAN
jgi:hypothetical protein